MTKTALLVAAAAVRFPAAPPALPPAAGLHARPAAALSAPALPAPVDGARFDGARALPAASVDGRGDGFRRVTDRAWHAMAELGPMDRLAVVVEIAPDALPAPEGSREERIKENARRFAERAAPVLEALLSWGALHQSSWLQSAIRVELPKAGVLHLAKLPAVEKIDLPNPLSRD